MNYVADDSFEGSGWSEAELGTLAGGVTQYLPSLEGESAQAGLYVMQLRSFKGTVLGVPGTIGGACYQTVTGLGIGEEYEVSCWLHLHALSGTPNELRCRLDEGAGYVTLSELFPTDVDWDGFRLYSWGRFTATATSVVLRFSTPPSGTNGDNAVWWLDSARLGEPMAVYMYERVVDAVVATLQTNLGTALTAITTEKGDSVELSAPSVYHKVQRAASSLTSGANVQCEVYEGPVALERIGTDIQSGHVEGEYPITIRLTYRNAPADSRETMALRGRRYLAGLVRTFLDYPTLGGADDSLVLAAYREARPQWELGEDGEQVTKASVALEVTVTCSEVNT